MGIINLARLKNCMRRASRGEELTLGFFGGSITQDCHNRLGDWYGLPHVSVRDTIYQRMLAGEMIRFLEQVKGRMDEPEEEVPLPAPMTANACEHARRLTVREVSPVLSGFRADPREKSGHLDCFKNGWFWTGALLFCWTGTSVRTGGTASGWSPSSTADSGGSTPWRLPWPRRRGRD